jgi:L-amino acid N-acyltransferase YncA
MPAALELRAVLDGDAAAIADIYNHYVLNTAISFEEAAVAAPEMAQRFKKVREANMPWLVALRADQVLGWAYATRWRERHAYRYTVEASVYVAPSAARQGVGAALYRELFPAIRAAGFRSVIGVIALPNEPSIALHEKFGMHKVAHFAQVGFKFGRWHDVGNWQVVL